MKRETQRKTKRRTKRRTKRKTNQNKSGKMVHPFKYIMDIGTIPKILKRLFINSTFGWNKKGHWKIHKMDVKYATSISEIQSLVKKCKLNNKTITTRGGGHCYNNTSIQGDYVLSLKNLYKNEIYIDDSKKSLKLIVDSTIRLGEIYNYVNNYNKKNNRKLLISGGTCATVGIGGFILGGGHGLLEPYYGSLCHLLTEAEGVDGLGRHITINNKGIYDKDLDKYIKYGSNYISSLRGAGHNMLNVTQFTIDITSLPEHTWDYKTYYLEWNGHDKKRKFTNNIINLYKLLNDLSDTSTPYLINGISSSNGSHPLIDGGSPSEFKKNKKDKYQIELKLLIPCGDILQKIKKRNTKMISLEKIEKRLLMNDFKKTRAIYNKDWYDIWFNHIGEFWDLDSNKYSTDIYWDSLVVERNMKEKIKLDKLEFNDLPDRFDFFLHLNNKGLYYTLFPEKQPDTIQKKLYCWPPKNIKYVLQIFSYKDRLKLYPIKDYFPGDKCYINYPPSTTNTKENAFIRYKNKDYYNPNKFYDTDRINTIKDAQTTLDPNRIFNGKLSIFHSGR